MLYHSFLSKKAIAGIALALFLFAGCGEDEEKVALKSIEVTPAQVELTLGGTPQQLTATPTPKDAADVVFKWTSANNAVATVSDKGLVTAVNVGNTTVKVASGGIEKSVSVTVVASFTPSLEVTPAEPEQALAAGGVFEFAIAANADWTYTLSEGADAWLTQASKTAAALTLTVAANTTTEEKTATVTFALAGEHSAVTQAVAVSQAAFAPALEVTPATSVQASAAGDPLVFAIAANADWTYSLSGGAEAWLTEPNKTTDALTLTVVPNATEEAKTATVTFSLTGYPAVTQEVEVSQAVFAHIEDDFGPGAAFTVLTVTSGAELKGAESLPPGNYIANIAGDIELSFASGGEGDKVNITLGTPGVTISLRGSGSNTISTVNDANLVRIAEGKLILRDVTLSKTGAQMSTVAIGASGQLVIHDGVSIVGTGSSTNSGVRVEGGQFLMKGGKIYGHRGPTGFGPGGVLINTNGTFQMDGGEIYDNTAGYAGGIFIRDAGSSFIMNGGELYDNHSNDADEGGGAVYIWQNGHVEIHSGAIIYGKEGRDGKAGNTSVVSGGDTYGHAVTAFYTGSSGKYRSTTIQNEELSITVSGGGETGSSGTWDSFGL
jgi:hypothetical protein